MFALYFNNIGCCILNRVCGFGCHSTASLYHFDYIYTSNSVDYFSKIDESSICYSFSESSRYTLYHNYGCISFKKLNMSNNKHSYYSAIYAAPTANSQSLSFSLNYSSIANNTAKSRGCIYLEASSALYCIGTSNIINN